MKKITILSVLLTLCFFNSWAYSIQTKSEDYEIIQDTSSLFNDHKPRIIMPLDSNNIEYKYRSGNFAGYINKETNFKFVSKYHDMYLMDEYLKVEKDGKYGVMDKKGHTILPPAFQKITVEKFNNDKYFLARYQGQPRLFKTNGKLISGEELYSINAQSTFLLAYDIRPEFIRPYPDTKNVYAEVQQSDASNSETQKVASDTLNEPEISTLPLPEKVKVHQVPNNFKEVNNSGKTNQQTNDIERVLQVKNKQYYITGSGNKYGLKDSNQKEILPEMFSDIRLTTLIGNYNEQVLLTNKGSVYFLYDLKGNLLAEKVDNKVNVYSNGNVYNVEMEDNVGILYKNGKQKGVFTRENDEYKFVSTGIDFFKSPKVNDIIITILSL